MTRLELLFDDPLNKPALAFRHQKAGVDIVRHAVKSVYLAGIFEPDLKHLPLRVIASRREGRRVNRLMAKRSRSGMVLRGGEMRNFEKIPDRHPRRKNFFRKSFSASGMPESPNRGTQASAAAQRKRSRAAQRSGSPLGERFYRLL